VLEVGTATRLKGYEVNAWNAALDAAGYPKSVPSSLMPKPKEPVKADAKGELKPAAGGGEGKQ
jgi:hypothetical protein